VLKPNHIKTTTNLLPSNLKSTPKANKQHHHPSNKPKHTKQKIDEHRRQHYHQTAATPLTDQTLVQTQTTPTRAAQTHNRNEIQPPLQHKGVVAKKRGKTPTTNVNLQNTKLADLTNQINISHQQNHPKLRTVERRRNKLRKEMQVASCRRGTKVKRRKKGYRRLTAV